jgi:hypothetical protein
MYDAFGIDTIHWIAFLYTFNPFGIETLLDYICRAMKMMPKASNVCSKK